MIAKLALIVGKIEIASLTGRLSLEPVNLLQTVDSIPQEPSSRALRLVPAALAK